MLPAAAGAINGQNDSAIQALPSARLCHQGHCPVMRFFRKVRTVNPTPPVQERDDELEDDD